MVNDKCKYLLIWGVNQLNKHVPAKELRLTLEASLAWFLGRYQDITFGVGDVQSDHLYNL